MLVPICAACVALALDESLDFRPPRGTNTHAPSLPAFDHTLPRMSAIAFTAATCAPRAAGATRRSNRCEALEPPSPCVDLPRTLFGSRVFIFLALRYSCCPPRVMSFASWMAAARASLPVHVTERRLRSVGCYARVHRGASAARPRCLVPLAVDAPPPAGAKAVFGETKDSMKKSLCKGNRRLGGSLS